MEYLHKHLSKTSTALSKVQELNEIKNTSTEEEISSDLQTDENSLQPSTSYIISKKNTQRKRLNFVKNENAQHKHMKISDEIKMKSTSTMSKKEESLLIKLMIGERMDILNNNFLNENLEILNRRVEHIQRQKSHEEIVKTLLKKVSKLERRITAALVFQEEMLSKMAVHQRRIPRTYYQNTVHNWPGPSAFYPATNRPTSSFNTFLLSPCTGVPSAHVPKYISSNKFIPVSVKPQNSALANNSAIPDTQMFTQAEISATVSDFQPISTSSSTAKDTSLPRAC